MFLNWLAARGEVETRTEEEGRGGKGKAEGGGEKGEDMRRCCF